MPSGTLVPLIICISLYIILVYCWFWCKYNSGGTIVLPGGTIGGGWYSSNQQDDISFSYNLVNIIYNEIYNSGGTIVLPGGTRVLPGSTIVPPLFSRFEFFYNLTVLDLTYLKNFFGSCLYFIFFNFWDLNITEIPTFMSRVVVL